MKGSSQNKTLELLLLSAGIVVLTIVPGLSLALVAVLLWLIKIQISAIGWILLAPLIYWIWLMGVLVIYNGMNRLSSKRFQKPEFQETAVGADFQKNMMLVVFLYMRMNFLYSLPLTGFLVTLPFFRTLIYKSYALGCHLGSGVQIAGFMEDPDLTYLDDEVVIGHEARLVAHSFVMHRNRQSVYRTAAIRVGQRATIGGNVLIQLGTVIGDDAIIEPGSVVPPYSQIGAAEIWAGNPARKSGIRDGFLTPETAVSIEAVSETEIIDLVANALHVSKDLIDTNTSSDHLESWDSLGVLAIGAALFNRYGLVLQREQSQQLNSIQAIENIISDSIHQSPDVEKMVLPDNAELLPLLDQQWVTKALAQAHPVNHSVKQVQLCIAASYPAHAVEQSIVLWSRAFGLDVHVEFCGFDLAIQALLDANGLFRNNLSGINAVLIRAEDFWVTGNTQGLLLQYQKAFAAYQQQCQTPLIVTTLSNICESSTKQQALNALCNEWQLLLAKSGIMELDIQSILAALGTQQALNPDDPVIQYRDAFFQQLGIEIARNIRAIHIAPLKVIAVDCDNTLWGGVIGEDGLAGIELGSDSAGRNFTKLQIQLSRLQQQGVLLALLSRNNEQDVWQVFDQHPKMILKRDQISAWQINWQAKSNNLKLLAEALHVGLDSVLVIDDSDFERLEISRNCPQVTVLPLPEASGNMVDQMDRLWAFDAINHTLEDKSRTQYIHEDQHRKEYEQQTADLDSFLNELDLSITIRDATVAELPRICQLVQKTNQMNLSLKRRNEAEIQAILEHENQIILVLEAKDKFGDYGLVGVGIVMISPEIKIAQIDTFLLSCRALGRGVEQTFLSVLIESVYSRDCETLNATFKRGPRNQPVRDLFKQVGFCVDDPDKWVLQPIAVPAIPSHVNLN